MRGCAQDTDEPDRSRKRDGQTQRASVNQARGGLGGGSTSVDANSSPAKRGNDIGIGRTKGMLAAADRLPTITVEHTSASGQDFMQSGMGGFFSSGQQGMAAMACSSGAWSAVSMAIPAIGPDEAMAAAAPLTVAGPIRTASMANAQRMR